MEPSDAVTWWGHSTTTVELAGERFLTDPLLRDRVAFLRWERGHVAAPLDEPLTAALISHLHHDHLDLASLARLPSGMPVVAPAGATRLVPGLRRHTVVELDVGESTNFGEATVTAVHAEHDGRRHRLGGAAPALGYLVEGRDTVVYFAGDTGLHPGLRDLSHHAVNLAVIPVGGWGLTLGDEHLDPVRAAEAVATVRPLRAIPIHWGSLRIPVLWRARSQRFVGAGHQFAAAAAQLAPQVDVAVAPPGARVPVPPSVHPHPSPRTAR